MPQHTLLVAALATALATPLSAAADTATDASADASTLAAVRVTGSNIKRTDTEASNPVQVIGRQQLEQSGKATVADVLRSISANTGNATNETTNNGWASGSAGIGLRGLSQKNTLVLLNGRRLANYGFPSNGLSDTFVNLNALPLVAVERIEVLKDGASAVYGSDAVAGVVNIITRQGFEGAEIGGSAGTADQGGLDEHKLHFVGGIGDLDKDRYNILFSLEGYNRERLDQDQRDLTRSGIYTDVPGGRWNGWSAKGARYLVNGVSVPMLDANGNCPTGTTRVASAPIDGLPGDTCGFNQAPYTTLIPSTKRWQAYANGTFRLNDSVDAFGEVLYSDIKGTSWFGSSPYFTLEGGRFALNATSGLAEPVSNALPASSPYNPYGRAVPIEYTFFNLGGTLKTNRSRAYRGVFGLRGSIGGWDWEAAAFGARSSEHETVSGGFANRWALASALASGSYNLLNPSATPQSVLDAINLSTARPAESVLQGVDAKVSGTLGRTWAGDIGFAAGAEWRREKLDSNNPWQIDAGLQIRPAIAEVHGERKVSAAYAEVNVPLASTLELSAAARADHYDDFGDAFSPKIGLRWQPLDILLVRASASRGFRAPSLSENSNSTSIAYGSVVDPRDPDVPGSRQNPTFFTVGNDALKPERTRSVNVGVVLSPWANTSLSADYYRISLDNLVGTNNTQTLVNDNVPGAVLRDERGKLLAVYNRYQNLSELKTSGIDVELRQRIPTAQLGDFTVSSAFTHVRDYRRPSVTGGPLEDFAGSNLGPTLPKNKATTTLEWAYSDFRTALTWYYTGGYDQKASAAAQAVQSRVDSFSQLDLYLAWTGIDKLTVYAKVQNLADKAPPYDASFPGIRAPYDFTQYDLRGRYFTVGFDYRF
ncbi:TonB-dependent receptor [Stenotrophomonas sp. 24(2023)]|uniref:TonB-dependent receptor plug domain-containing protein n=1 Tax=Stenotrophomonas sp. 24(2023) TaxID=3068324 RepID=UPI0027E08CC2|nr:TonB-dependent receptor [Stenotrophomonas sp. 24(2023)]WMJ67716.1 TonB-dependent receptor [Stenotrophomonas sp. 24(2023)]